MALYGGIDLHSNNNVVALSDETDRVVYRQRLSNDVETVLDALAPHRAQITGLVVESTYNWYWLVDALMESGYRVHLANTAAIVQYSGLKYADDDSDAAWLAKLLRLGLLPEGYIYPKAARAVRDLLRRRLSLVQQHTANVLAVQNLFSRNRGRSMSANDIRRLTPERVSELVDDRPGRPLRTGRKLRLLLPLCGQPAPLQWQAQGQRQHQERQQVSGLGLCRGGELRRALQPADQALLSTQARQDQWRACDQGGRAQARARLLPHPARWH